MKGQDKAELPGIYTEERAKDGHRPLYDSIVLELQGFVQTLDKISDIGLSIFLDKVDVLHYGKTSYQHSGS